MRDARNQIAQTAAPTMTVGQPFFVVGFIGQVRSDSLTTVALMWRPFLQQHYPPSTVLQRYPTPCAPFASLPLLSVARHTRLLARGFRVSRVTTYSRCPTCHALRPRGSETRLAFIAGSVLISVLVNTSSFPTMSFRGSITSASRLTA